jgi:hypothetical protein
MAVTARDLGPSLPVSLCFPKSKPSHAKLMLLFRLLTFAQVLLLQKGDDDAAALGAARFTNLSLADGMQGSAKVDRERTNNRHKTCAEQRHRLAYHFQAAMPMQSSRKGRRMQCKGGGREALPLDLPLTFAQAVHDPGSHLSRLKQASSM